VQKMTGNEYRTMLVCMDDYQGAELQGRILNPCLSGAVHFESLMQMLLKIDALLDEMHFPQSYTIEREFSPARREPVNGEEQGVQRGELATFAVRVLFRQNASWQGSVTWLETGQEVSFRSALELLFLMNSALRPET
jgi:hypothetical protein